MVGWRQKARAAASASSTARSRSPVPSALPHQLGNWLSDWAWGKKSASDVVRDAYASSLDHQNDRLDKRIQRLANTRPNLQNAERVMESILPLQGMMEPHHVPQSSVEWVLLPHETLAWLQTAYPKRFSIHAGAKEGGVQDWWEGLRSSQSGKELWSLHSWLQRRTPQDLKFHVPLMMFDDAGPISNTSSSYVCVFYSLLGVGSDKQTRSSWQQGSQGHMWRTSPGPP